MTDTLLAPATVEIAEDFMSDYQPAKFSRIASEALQQTADLLWEHGEDLTANPALWEHTSLGSYLSLPAAITAVYRPELLDGHKYLATRVRSLRAIRYGLFHKFLAEFHEDAKDDLPANIWHRLNDLREAHKHEVLKGAGQWEPVFLYPDLNQLASLLEDYADVFAELEIDINQKTRS